MAFLKKPRAFIVLFVMLLSKNLLSQLPSGIDPGINDEAKYLWNEPVYIIVGVLLLIFIVLFFLKKWRPGRRDGSEE